MKRALFLVVLTTLAFTACHRVPDNKPEPVEQEQITLRHVADERFYSVTMQPSWEDTLFVFGIDNKLDVDWPDGLTPDAERELMKKLFDDETSTTFEEACERMLSTNWFEEDEDMAIKEVRQSNGLSDDEWSSYLMVESTARTDGELLSVTINSEMYRAQAAHGIYYGREFIYDTRERKVVHLSDLVDTALLGPVIMLAVEDLEVNADVREVVHEEYGEYPSVTSLPVPDEFVIDSTRSTIVLYYQVYEIACYASGAQAVVLPVFWLSKHLELTPYAKRLFGPTAYL